MPFECRYIGKPFVDPDSEQRTAASELADVIYSDAATKEGTRELYNLTTVVTALSSPQKTRPPRIQCPPSLLSRPLSIYPGLSWLYAVYALTLVQYLLFVFLGADLF